MTEKEFIESIDCKFPYHNRLVAQEVITLGIKVSSNAAFAILHEICRPPRGLSIGQTELLEFLDFWSSRFVHPLVANLVPFANSMIRQELTSVEATLETMKIVAKYPNQFAALAVLYFSCDDVDGEIETPYNLIIHNWNRFNPQQI